ncbi:MAG: glycosyltransferase, partial [Planctomycetota bacterium]
MSVKAINSREWWNDYFEKKWDDNQGSDQTRAFMEELLENLPSFERTFLEKGDLDVLDWGCAFGQGVEVLAAGLPQCRVSGIDFSEKAIDEARKRFPDCRFLHTRDGRIPERFDVVITSNCIEHFTEPFEVCRTLVAASKKLFIATVPYNESPMLDQHFSQFREESFPESIGDFRRIDWRVYDSNPLCWGGKQMLVVYGSIPFLMERLAHEAAAGRLLPAGVDSGFVAALEHGEMIRRVSGEFAQRVTTLVPPGGRILEFESGPAWLSRAIAKLGSYQVTILSHSEEYLEETRELFAQEELPAQFVRDNPRGYGSAQHDLVFSASMMDDRDPEDGAALLKAMASRSKRLVACLEPNPLNYWHGLYRLARGEGREDSAGERGFTCMIADLFDVVRMPLKGQAYLGQEVSEALVSHLKKIPLDLLRQIMSIHHARTVTPEITHYFRLSLGSVIRGPLALPADWIDLEKEGKDEKPARGTDLQMIKTLAKEALPPRDETILDESPTEERIEEATLVTLARDLEDKERKIKSLSSLLKEKDQQIHALNTQIEQFTRSISGAVIQKLFTLIRRVAPLYSRRHLFLMKVSAWFKNFLGKLRRIRPFVSAWMRSRNIPAPMSWYAYAFDRFKRDRLARISNRLESVRCPSKPGMASVVLPVYNGDDYLREALDSILGQRYTNFELIVVDDGSEDSTPEILAEYAEKEPRMKVITQENQKLPRALSNGFHAAQGEFLTWTSVDNRMKPDFLLRMIQCMNRHPRWDMIYANEDIIGDDGKPLKKSSWFSGYQKPAGSEHVQLPADPSELNTWPNNYVGGAFMYRDRVA